MQINSAKTEMYYEYSIIQDKNNISYPYNIVNTLKNQEIRIKFINLYVYYCIYKQDML